MKMSEIMKMEKISLKNIGNEPTKFLIKAIASLNGIYGKFYLLVTNDNKKIFVNEKTVLYKQLEKLHIDLTVQAFEMTVFKKSSSQFLREYISLYSLIYVKGMPIEKIEFDLPSQ